MLIDIHAHIFPDKIASATLSLLAGRAGISPVTDGTMRGMASAMERSCLDTAVIVPIVTAPKQFDSILRFAASVNETYESDCRLYPGGVSIPRMISFASIHPDCEDIAGKLRLIKAEGFRGIKLHPDYQGVFFNDIRMKRIVSLAAELSLAVIVHAGVDIGLPGPVHCTPQMAAEVLRETQADKLILAHMGGWKQWDAVEELLVGQKVYMDTAFIYGYLDREQFMRIVQNHGSDRILFGTDSPWADAAVGSAWLEECGLSEDVKEAVCWRNTARLLDFL